MDGRSEDRANKKPVAGAARRPGEFTDHMQPRYVADTNKRLTDFNQPFIDLASALFPEFRQKERREQKSSRIPQEFIPIFERMSAGEDHIRQSIEVELLGKKACFRVDHFAIREAGQLKAFTGSYTDISEEMARLYQTAQELQRYQDIVQAGSDWTWETDEKFILTNLSDGVSEFLIPSLRI